MAEPGRASALGGTRPASSETRSLLLTERRGLSLVHLAGRPARPGFLEAVRAALGVALPLEPDTAAGTRELIVFWLGPTRWLVESGHLAAAELKDRLRAAPAAAGIAIADLTGARTVIRISGEAARRTLAQGCPLDVHPRAFPPGRVAHSMFAGMAVMLHHLPDGDAFDLYVARSYALAAWELLAEAGAERDRPPA